MAQGRMAAVGLACVAWAWAPAVQGQTTTPHSQVLACGGLTFFLGDGRLRYAPERIVEAYDAWTPAAGLALSFDAQRISNPGYNADRGPASFFALRLYVER